MSTAPHSVVVIVTAAAKDAAIADAAAAFGYAAGFAVALGPDPGAGAWVTTHYGSHGWMTDAECAWFTHEDRGWIASAAKEPAAVGGDHFDAVLAAQGLMRKPAVEEA